VRERLINRRQQGDLGEASAIEWLTRVGATVSIPFGHSPDYDLVAEIEGRLLRVQVKTSVFQTRTPNGHPRYGIGLATNGGNQSWSGRAKRFDPSRADLLFVLIGDGRRWLIPAAAVEASNSILLGGPKYSEFEILGGQPIQDLVYGPEDSSLESDEPSGEYRSGQTGCAVNALAYAFAGSNPASPITVKRGAQPSKYERKLGRSGQAIINYKRRVTIPQMPFFEAGFETGDRLRARCDGYGRVILERIELPSSVRPDGATPEN
jgi:PD-(D/E)XK endonuclease